MKKTESETEKQKSETETETTTSEREGGGSKWSEYRDSQGNPFDYNPNSNYYLVA